MRTEIQRRVLCGVAGVSAALLLVRGVAGPLPWMHSPLTAECALAVSVVWAWLTREGTATASRTGSGWLAGVLVFMAAVAAYVPVLGMPLITDDYIHMQQIKDGLAPSALGCLTHSCGGPQVYRPLGFATYRAEWQLWGTAARPRHGFDLLLHGVCSVLFLLLVRRLGVPEPLDWLGALVFAGNGVRVEAVAWSGARFDTLAVLFGLAAAVCLLRSGRIWWVASLVATAAACLSKESAYAVPVLLALVAGRKALPHFGVAAAIFLWRWRVLDGIGGYLGEDAAPTVLQFHAVVFLKTFLARIWGVLWFPLNWSTSLEWWMALGLAAGLVGSFLLVWARPDRRKTALCVAGVVAACIPTHHLLLIGPSLERSRYLDLASIAFTCLLVFAAVALPKRVGVAALALMAGFQVAALEHNLGIWSRVSQARYEFCRSLAERARLAPGLVEIQGVPFAVDGIYWRNGIEECLWMEFGIPMGKVRISSGFPESVRSAARPQPSSPGTS